MKLTHHLQQVPRLRLSEAILLLQDMEGENFTFKSSNEHLILLYSTVLHVQTATMSPLNTSSVGLESLLVGGKYRKI